MEVPANLITTSWNLMHLHKASGSDQAPPSSCQVANQNSSSSGSGQKVYIRHMRLQDKLLKVRIDSAISADGLAVENAYSKEVGNIEMNRYRALHSCPNENVKETINSYYDKERIQLADKTEEKLDQLIEKAEKMRIAALRANNDAGVGVVATSCDSNPGKFAIQNKPTEGASLLLQPVDESDSKMNAVRKLKFNMSDEQCEEEEEENDYLNGSVNSEDFEIDEIDVETVEADDHSGSRVSTPVEFQNPSSNSSDLLQQCIEESGLAAIHEAETVTSTSNSPCENTSNSCAVQKISEPKFAQTSQIAETPTTTSPVTSTMNFSTQTVKRDPELSTPSAFQQFPQQPGHPGMDLFGTPKNFGTMFTHPDQISMAMSEIGKLCGGPSITFTPEMRREIIQQGTPDIPGFSPFGRSMDFNYGIPTSTSSSHYGKTWNNPLDVNGNYGKRIGSGQKRKSPCLEEDSETNQPTRETSPVVQGNINNSIDSNGNHEVSSASECKVDGNILNNPQFKVHRMLTPESTSILTHWYNSHIQYPYPNDEEVQQLSQLTGITGRQVKKWMANKRVRCFNTLSITGNQHPIKFKYGGAGRKKKKTATEKENCDSTTRDKKANYSLLSEEAKVKLNNWYEAHKDNPYPSEDEKQQLAVLCNISVNQVKSWFANKRNRNNNTKRQVPNYFINKFPEYSGMVQYVGQRREEARMIKRRKINEMNMYIQPNFYF